MPEPRDIDAAVNAQTEEMVTLRRHMHLHPELSHQEFRTTEMLAERLRALGLTVHIRPEQLGLYADLVPPGYNPERHRTVAVRADIDALPIHEQSGLPFASSNPGVMHACGHDMHSGCVLGVALALVDLRDQLPGRVRFFFQHSEEVAPGGAEDMVAFGCMQGVDAVIGLHVDPGLELGWAGVKDGPLTASADAFTIEIQGRGGHAARPHQCVDPVFVATQIASAIYQTVGRVFDARDPVVLTVASMQAGDGYNVIPNGVTLRGTSRTLSVQNREQIEPLLKRITDNLCNLHGASGEVRIDWGAPPIANDPMVNSSLREAARSVLGTERVQEISLPSMGAEDFSYYLEQAPGAMFRLGTRSPGAPEHHLHSPHFSPDEGALVLGARILAHAALDLLGGGR